MCRWLRNTVSRPHSVVPWIFLRTRSWRRLRPASRVSLIAFAPCRLLACGLAGLLAHGLAVIANALALVRLRRAEIADVGRDLADSLFADAAHDDHRRAFALNLDAFRHRELDLVRVAERHDESLAAHFGLVTHTADLELLLETLGDALHAVRDQRPRQAVQRLVLRRLARARDAHVLVGDGHRHVRMDALRMSALRPLSREDAALHLHLDAGRNHDRQPANPRHGVLLPDLAEQLAADALLACLHAGHQALRSAQDRRAVPAAHARNRVDRDVDATPGLADALEAAD